MGEIVDIQRKGFMERAERSREKVFSIDATYNDFEPHFKRSDPSSLIPWARVIVYVGKPVSVV